MCQCGTSGPEGGGLHTRASGKWGVASECLNAAVVGQTH